MAERDRGSSTHRVESTSAVQELLDRSDVAAVLVAYADAVDDRDWDTFESLFSPDAQIDYSRALGPTGGRGAIRHWMAENLTRERLPHCQHLVVNVSVQVDADQASARSAYLNADVVALPDGGPGLLLQGGTYRAELVRDGRWRIRALRAELLWHMAGDRAAAQALLGTLGVG